MVVARDAVGPLENAEAPYLHVTLNPEPQTLDSTPQTLNLAKWRVPEDVDGSAASPGAVWNSKKKELRQFPQCVREIGRKVSICTLDYTIESS